MRVRLICETCGSDDVLRDAWAAWDRQAQAWEVSAVMDAGWCNDCAQERELHTLPELVS